MEPQGDVNGIKYVDKTSSSATQILVKMEGLQLNLDLTATIGSSSYSSTAMENPNLFTWTRFTIILYFQYNYVIFKFNMLRAHTGLLNSKSLKQEREVRWCRLSLGTEAADGIGQYTADAIRIKS